MSSFQLERPRQRRRLVSLTPMIDVVFLLLVFFMLVSRFAIENATSVSSAQSGLGAPLDGPPRLVQVTPKDILLNDAPIAREALAPALAKLSPSPNAAVVVKATKDVRIQRLIDVVDMLKAAKLGPVLLME
ncbi:MAG: biopolymer transporter ExbD [Neomegalonema sp.]|nr:biopolymer transporter ExbD [Neomegalonema sp.]